MQHAFFAHVMFWRHHVESPTLTHKKKNMSTIDLFNNQSDDGSTIGEQLSCARR